MDHPSKIGFSFGATSGIITTLGLIVGLTASDASRAVVIGGVLTIAFADAFSDALGIHVSEESEGNHTKREIWVATLSTYFTKLVIALSFLIPLALFSPTIALIVSIVWGSALLTLLNYIIAPRDQKWSTISEHLLIGMVVIIIGFVIGQFIKTSF